MKVVNNEKEQNYDYSEYGYKPNTPITIDSELFGVIGELIQYIGQKETTIGFEQLETLEATLGETNRAMQVMSPQAIKALSASMALNICHEQNVKSGLAIHRTELEKPKISLQD